MLAEAPRKRPPVTLPYVRASSAPAAGRTTGSSALCGHRIGDAVEDLLREIPAALLAAHRRAYDSYVGQGVRTKAYGLIWKVQHVELVARLRGIEEARVFEPKGARYELVMIGSVVLYPWRYADGNLTPLEYARMELSDIRRTEPISSPGGGGVGHSMIASCGFGW